MSSLVTISQHVRPQFLMFSICSLKTKGNVFIHDLSFCTVAFIKNVLCCCLRFYFDFGICDFNSCELLQELAN